MTARELEASGIATIVIGSAMDIVTHCKVPRYLHNNFPLGNPLGAPDDRAAQRQTIMTALKILSDSTEPAVIESQLVWPGIDDWQSVYNRVDENNRQQLRQMGEENRAKRLRDKSKGLKR